MILFSYDLYSLIIVLNPNNQQFDLENYREDVVRLIEHDHQVYPD